MVEARDTLIMVDDDDACCRDVEQLGHQSCGQCVAHNRSLTLIDAFVNLAVVGHGA
jgi:hypothetical protein